MKERQEFILHLEEVLAAKFPTKALARDFVDKLVQAQPLDETDKTWQDLCTQYSQDEIIKKLLQEFETLTRLLKNSPLERANFRSALAAFKTNLDSTKVTQVSSISVDNFGQDFAVFAQKAHLCNSWLNGNTVTLINNILKDPQYKNLREVLEAIYPHLNELQQLAFQEHFLYVSSLITVREIFRKQQCDLTVEQIEAIDKQFEKPDLPEYYNWYAIYWNKVLSAAQRQAFAQDRRVYPAVLFTVVLKEKVPLTEFQKEGIFSYYKKNKKASIIAYLSFIYSNVLDQEQRKEVKAKKTDNFCIKLIIFLDEAGLVSENNQEVEIDTSTEKIIFFDTVYQDFALGRSSQEQTLRYIFTEIEKGLLNNSEKEQFLKVFPEVKSKEYPSTLTVENDMSGKKTYITTTTDRAKKRNIEDVFEFSNSQKGASSSETEKSTKATKETTSSNVPSRTASKKTKSVKPSKGKARQRQSDSELPIVKDIHNKGFEKLSPLEQLVILSAKQFISQYSTRVNEGITIFPHANSSSIYHKTDNGVLINKITIEKPDFFKGNDAEFLTAIKKILAEKFRVVGDAQDNIIQRAEQVNPNASGSHLVNWRDNGPKKGYAFGKEAKKGSVVVINTTAGRICLNLQAELLKLLNQNNNNNNNINNNAATTTSQQGKAKEILFESASPDNQENNDHDFVEYEYEEENKEEDNQENNNNNNDSSTESTQPLSKKQKLYHVNVNDSAQKEQNVEKDTDKEMDDFNKEPPVQRGGANNNNEIAIEEKAIDQSERNKNSSSMAIDNLITTDRLPFTNNLVPLQQNTSVLSPQNSKKDNNENVGLDVPMEERSEKPIEIATILNLEESNNNRQPPIQTQEKEQANPSKEDKQPPLDVKAKVVEKDQSSKNSSASKPGVDTKSLLSSLSTFKINLSAKIQKKKAELKKVELKEQQSLELDEITKQVTDKIGKLRKEISTINVKEFNEDKEKLLQDLNTIEAPGEIKVTIPDKIAQQKEKLEAVNTLETTLNEINQDLNEFESLNKEVNNKARNVQDKLPEDVNYDSAPENN